MHFYKNLLLVVGSAGGHITEAEYVLRNYHGRKILITSHLKVRDNSVYESMSTIVNPWKNNPLLYFVNFIQSIFLIIRFRPKAIFTTGAGIAIPICLLGKLISSKIIFMESCCRIDELSKTGKFLYFFSDEFIIQDLELGKRYKKSIYLGSLL